MASKIETYIVRTDGELGRTFENIEAALMHALDVTCADRGTHIIMPDNTHFVIVRRHPKWSLKLVKDIS